jgi:NADPH:quinone reductase-like Zn-dependent oxidoreductase
VLRIADVPAVAPAPGEVSVKVTHVALNHLDLWVRRGVPGHDFHLPHVPGSDVAGFADGRPVALHPSWGCGVCAACLAGRQNRCRDFKIRGENVDGGMATEVVVPRWQLLPVPGHLSLAEAASMPLTLLTAWHMLVVRAGLARGEKVLVQAGASGVGVMAVQIARLYGCEVHATASTEARRAKLAELGATPWPYEAIGARNFDVVVESVGGPTWDASQKALAWGGRLVICGATGGHEARMNLRALFFKQLDVLGSTMGTSADMAAAWREVEAGRIRPMVDRVMPMSRVGEAHGVLERREAFGKVVLENDLR